MTPKAVIDTRGLGARGGIRPRLKGRQPDPRALGDVRALLGDAPRRRDLLVEHLHRIQDRYGSLSAAHLAALADEMKLALAEVYEVATFYHHFDVVKEGETPPPEITVRVCETLSCELAGASALRAEVARRCGANVRVVGAPCIGRCEQAPAAVVGKNPIDRATPEKVAHALSARQHAPQIPPYIDRAAYCADGGYRTLAACVRGDRSVDATIAALEDSGLRGLGGAGFPAGRKWRIVRAESAPRLLAVNIDEGEPGTFKDRFYLERDPHRFLEGTLIAAWAVGIDDVYIYLRDEYAACRAILTAEIEALQREPPCPLPRLHLRRGAGAYICGEESAMIESIEGKRGMPRLRPPYVAQVGLFGRPTLEHNMETLYWVRDVLEKGAAWFASHGRHGRKGLRSFSVSGRVAKPGVHLAPAGITVRELIDEYCGGMLPGTRALRLSPRWCLGRHPSGNACRCPARFRHAAATRLLHRLRGGDRALAARPCARRGAEPDALFRRRVVRAVHAVPRGHREGGAPDGQVRVGCAAVDRAVAGDGRRVDLRARASGAESDCLRDPVFPGGAAMRADGVAFQLNGREMTAAAGETIIEAAQRHGVEIPHLCYMPGMRPDGNCRACMVEIKGERVLAPSCCRTPGPGMEVSSQSPRAIHAQKMIVELLAADVPAKVYKPDSELEHWKRWLGVGVPRFEARAQPAADLSHPAMAVNLDACIQCTRCVRACREEQVNDVIGYAFRGAHSAIVFDFGDPMGASTCVACGECVQACPTGALAPAQDAYLVAADRSVASVCPYCGVGCQLTYHVKDNCIVRVDGRDGPANHSRLCVKGRFGFDYVHHPQRLTKPLIRKPGVPKTADFVMDPADPRSVFREASWDEALDLAGGTLRKIRDAHGGQALAGFGSAKGSNEEAYLFQKLVRTGFRTNNVDHCTRLCHASSVAALLEGIGSGAVSNPVMDVLQAEVVLLIGANPVVNHPVAATWIKNATKRGTKLILVEPRRSELARHAAHFLQLKPDTDVALLNAMLHTIVEEGLVAERFVADRTSGYAEMRKNVAGHSPEAMAPVCGIPAPTIREVARLFATSQRIDDPVGNGNFAAHPRHRQRPLPDRSLADDGAGGAAGNRIASVARPEQRAGRERRRPDPDDVSRLPARRQCRGEGCVRGAVGNPARPEGGTHRGRDHGRRACREDPRHVRDGREPRDVRS